MGLQPFRTPTAEFSSSIVVDTSTVGDTTVTVAVAAERQQEPRILKSFYRYGSEIGFKPFYHKATDFDHGARCDFAGRVIRANRVHVSSFAHNHSTDGNVNTHQVEAVQSSILVHELLTDSSEAIVVVDGGEQQARPLLQAINGLRSPPPIVAHCIQSEYYYPTALLADMCANYLATEIENSGSPTLISSPYAKRTRSSEWGRAFSSLFSSSLEYDPPDLFGRWGDTVRERICCWYRGAVALSQRNERPFTDSLNPVVQALRRDGYDDLADTLAEL